MRNNSLFISTATQNDHEALSRIARFFRDVQYGGAPSALPTTISSTFKEAHIDPRAITFLRTTGTGIVGLEQRENRIHEPVKILNDRLPGLTPQHFGDETAPTESNGRDMEIHLLHQGSTKQHALPLQCESAGTRRLLVILSKALRALDEGALLIIDELNTSVHTLVAKQLLALFTDPEYNPRGAQLIAATHDTNLMACDHVRRDQIWFCEKDDIGVSRLFPLSDFRLRPTPPDRQGLSRWPLRGGAVHGRSARAGRGRNVTSGRGRFRPRRRHGETSSSVQLIACRTPPAGCFMPRQPLRH